MARKAQGVMRQARRGILGEAAARARGVKRFNPRDAVAGVGGGRPLGTRVQSWDGRSEEQW